MAAATAAAMMYVANWNGETATEERQRNGGNQALSCYAEPQVIGEN